MPAPMSDMLAAAVAAAAAAAAAAPPAAVAAAAAAADARLGDPTRGTPQGRSTTAGTATACIWVRGGGKTHVTAQTSSGHRSTLLYMQDIGGGGSGGRCESPCDGEAQLRVRNWGQMCVGGCKHTRSTRHTTRMWVRCGSHTRQPREKPREPHTRSSHRRNTQVHEHTTALGDTRVQRRGETRSKDTHAHLVRLGAAVHGRQGRQRRQRRQRHLHS